MTKQSLKLAFLVVLSFLLNISLWANVKLPALVGDNMVLQRDSKINLWGWADPGEKVGILFQNKQLTMKTGKDGKWTMVLPPHPAGGPFEMIIKGKNTITIKNILIGDVWLASGQSNMEFALKDAINSKQEIEIANNSQIRLFTVKHKTAFQPQNEVDSKAWVVCSPDLVKDFSAIAYLFGRKLNEKYHVPIGLINSSWGGTPAESWTSSEGFKNLEFYKESATNISKISNTEFEAFNKKRLEWSNQNDSHDRGFMPNGKTWADTDLSTDDWATLQFPGFWTGIKEIKGYGGTIWFRKVINLPVEVAGQPIELHFSSIIMSDSTYFNGKLVGNGSGYGKERVYTVPGNLAKQGRSVITIRIKGATGVGGAILGASDKMFALSGDTSFPLSGDWQYKTGPDISSFPSLPGLDSYNAVMPNVPTIIYNGMIAPLVPFSIKGVIWYQGESNADNMKEALQYDSLFPAMIQDWRHKWGYDFPFLFVQLAGYQPDEPEPADYVWAHLREAQYKTLALPNTGMAVAIDIGDEKNIHPKNKLDVANRLFLAAEKVAYFESVVYSGPTLRSTKIEGDRIRLRFDNLGSGLYVKGDKYGYIRGFAIAGADKKFVWAKAYQEGEDVVVYSENIKQPIALRYDWGNTPDGNLYNIENLPAVPFRTDDW